MLLMLQFYVLIFVPLLGNCANLHQWKSVLPYFNIKYFQETRFSLSEAVNNTLCAKDFQMYVDQIIESNWAIQMFDSSTKFPESVLMGQSVFLGNFDECVGVKGVETDSGNFKGQHCLVDFQGKPAQFRTHELYDVPDMGGFREYIHDVSDKDRTAIFPEVSTTLTLSYCIPSTCTAKDLEDIFNSYLQGINLSITATTNEEYCQTNERKELGAEDWVAVGVFVVFLLLIVASTAYDVLMKGMKKELLIAFSLFSNGKKLLSTKTSEDTLHAINGMRFITICWIVWCHRYKMDMAVPSVNFNTVQDFIQDVGRLYITNGSLAADTFFVISGLLVSYVFLKQMKNKTSCFNIPLYYLHRYIRLTPPYAVVILFVATLYRHVGTGPLLPAVTSGMAEDCQKYWWTNILYINNYVAVDHMCLGQSWYLSADMQLYILSPLLLYPLWKWPRKWNSLLLGILIIAGIVSPFTISYINEISANLIFGNEGRQPNVQDELYITTYSRFGPWVIGVAFGYIIYEAKQKELKLSPVQIAFGWILSNVAMLGSLNGIYSFYQPDASKTVLESAFYNGLFRNVWALGVGVTIFLCVTGHGGPPNVVLSWKIFPTLSRLSYCIYLTHYNYQVVETFTARTPIYIADLNEWPGFFADGLVSLLLALILSLSIEAPAINLEKCLLGRGRTHEENTQAEAHPKPQEVTENEQENTWNENADALEDPKSNFTGVQVEGIRSESMENLIKE